MKSAFGLGAKRVALVAVMTATVEAAKLALAAVPNVEAVTLLCAVYGYVFGGLGVFATSLFVVVETLIYPIHSWVIYYAIHWNAIALSFWLLKKFKVKNVVILTTVALLHVTFFGVESSLIDTLLFSGVKNFWKKFATMYVRGQWFYITELVCNLILFPLAFKPLVHVLEKAKTRFFTPTRKTIEPPPERAEKTE